MNKHIEYFHLVLITLENILTLEKEQIFNKNLGCLYYEDIQNMKNYLLISKEELMNKKRDLYKIYDKLRYEFLLIKEHEKLIQLKYITEEELLQLINYYKINKPYFLDRFNKEEILELEKIIEKI